MKHTTAIFGGSFNPPHCGHTAFVEALANDPRFSEIWIEPCDNHAFGKELEPFTHRYQMCRIAFSPLGEHVEIRQDELRAPGSGYTVELIRFLTETYKERRFALVLGADNYAVKDEWKDFDVIESLVEVVFFGRKGWQGSNQELDLETPFPEISSTEIRDRLAKGEPVGGLVPDAVAGYIRRNRLYSS